MQKRSNFNIKKIKESNKNIRTELIDLALYLDKHLSSEWEIYIHPFVNSERPDLAILHPEIGTAIFHTFYDSGENLTLSINKVTSSNNSYISHRLYNKDEKKSLPYPLKQLNFITENLINIYVPDIGHSSRRDNAVLKLVKRVLYVPNMNPADAKRLFSDKREYYTFLTKSDLSNEGFRKFYNTFLTSSKIPLERAWYNELKFMYDPPVHKSEEGKHIKFYDNQSNYAFHQPGKHHRFKGVAGSGKTLVLVHRAADIAAKGKKVLFLTYNITLINYIQYLLKQMPLTFDFENIVITNYHHFCSLFFRENNINWPKEKDETTRDILDKSVPNKLISALEQKRNILNRQYDAILMDEVQDFHINWLESVQPLLTENNEIVITGDDNQDIYERGTSQLDQFKSGFSGPWGNIKFCHRLPYKIILEVNRFAKQYFEIDDNIKSYLKRKNELFDPKLFWYDLKEDDVNRVLNIFKQLLDQKIIHNYDSVILIPNTSIGVRICNLFKKHGIEVEDVFNDRNKKLSFKYGSPFVKVSTLQSFKGWEYSNIILYSPSADNIKVNKSDKLFYTAITRATKNLVVINSNTRYQQFGMSSNWEYKKN